MKLVSDSKNGLDWRFQMSSFRYKDVDLLGSASLQLSLAVPGIGLPEETFIKFSKLV